jgi:hypothetical protein
VGTCPPFSTLFGPAAFDLWAILFYRCTSRLLSKQQRALADSIPMAFRVNLFSTILWIVRTAHLGSSCP